MLPSTNTLMAITSTRMKMDDRKFILVFYQNEVGLREYNQGDPLIACKDKIRDYYKDLSDKIDQMNIEEFEHEYFTSERYRPKYK